jgi:secreted trypsin-like serine protease
MRQALFTTLVAAMAGLSGGAALAQQDITAFLAGSGNTDGPYSFAESGRKAEVAAKATAAGAKVIGGEVAADGAWPWQVALVVNGVPVSTDSQFCGGSLVMDTWVLTAAHCVHMADDQGTWGDINPQAISILAGTNKLDGTGDVIPVEKIVVHPSYVGTLFDYDIALIKLARAPSVPYKIIEVPDADYGAVLNQQGVTTVVTGWGLQNGAAPSPELRQAQIQMLDRELCNNAMMEARAEEAAKGFGYAAEVFGLTEDDAYALWDQLVSRAPMPLSENMLCSGTFEGGKTSCNGDSGGPLVVPLEDGSYIQAGIVSWGLTSSTGKGCEETATFSAYTDISRFVPWLREVIETNP